MKVAFLSWLLVVVWTGAAQAGAFVINEVVADPQQDWHDQSAFDATPGSGSATSADEWVELKNVSAAPASLAGFRLTIDDGSAAVDCFGFSAVAPCSAAAQYRVFDAAGVETGDLAAVPAGGYVVVGDPSGAINNAATLTLRDALGAAVDVAVIDAGAGSLADEAAARLGDGFDSDSPADFVPLAASPGSSNGALCALAPGTALVHEVVADPQQDRDLDGAVDEADELVEIKNAGAAADLRGCVLELADGSDERVVLQPIDARLAVFDEDGAPAGSLAAVPAGGYVVVMNPPGAINQRATISLRGEATIDVVAFGDDAPELAASGLDSEAGARVPDGADSGVGAVDFKRQRATPGKSNELDECALGLAECPGDTTCDDTAAGYACACAPGYRAHSHGCVDIDECAEGSHDCSIHAVCENGTGHYTCQCGAGHAGDGRACADIDECALAPCHPDAACTNSEGSYACACLPGWEGDGHACRAPDAGASQGGAPAVPDVAPPSPAGCAIAGGVPAPIDCALVVLLLFSSRRCTCRRRRK